MKAGLLACLLLWGVTAFGQEPEVPETPAFNPDVTAADLSEIRHHITQLEGKITMYKIINSRVSQGLGVIVAIMGGLDMYSVFSASKADMYVISQVETLETRAIGLGLETAMKAGRLGAYANLPARAAKFFNSIGATVRETTSTIMIVNSKVLSSGATLAGVSWYAFSAALVPSLIKYNMVELSMLKAYAASLSQEKQNLQEENPKK